MDTLTNQQPAVAIIGMGCRFPGGVSNVDQFWQLIERKTDAIIEIPPTRWDYRKFYHPNTNKPGKSYSRWGGFLHENIYDFDPLFFGISPREAESMDPQQRYVLRVTYEALEDAGLQTEALQGSNTGVFIGGFTLDNKLSQLSQTNLHLIDANTATGMSMAILSNRVSHAFDFRGPSLSVDTACSSSLVTTHLAAQSIRSGDCDVAIAGGVTIMSRPEYPVAMSNGGFLSTHGRCMAFDERAAGYTRAEGCGVVVLKSLSKAIEDGDHIYSVVRNSGINQDGATKGIAFPNGDSQQALIEKVYAQAGLSTSEVHVFEAHGTGTQAGDTTECAAIHRVFSQAPRDEPLVVGSVKTNIGHLEAAAGVAGLIKASLMVSKSAVLPNIHFETPNPKIPFKQMGLRVPTDVEPWPVSTPVRRAAVNSFGYGGTNAHMVLESCDHLVKKPTETYRLLASENQIHNGKASINKDGDHQHDAVDPLPTYLLPITARDETALRKLAGLYAEQLQQIQRADDLHNFLYSAAHRRSHHRHRACFAGNSATALCIQLLQYANGDAPEGHCYAQAPSVDTPSTGESSNLKKESPLVFVCTGMGPQWHAMGQELYRSEPVFRDLLNRADAIFIQLSGWSILDEMLKKEADSQIHKTSIAQPANFMLQTGLVELYRHYGLVPDIVTGHSVGEVSAAYISGALSLNDALVVCLGRSQLQETLAGTGSMLAASLTEEQAHEECAGMTGIEVAAVNSPASVTLAGSHSQLEKLAAELEKRDIFARLLAVEVPYHSSLMEPIEAPLRSHLAGINTQQPTTPLYSTVTADNAAELPLDADYWWRNVRHPVQFGKTIEKIATDTKDPIFLEIGPHPVLKHSIVETLKETGLTGQTTHTLHRKANEILSMRLALGRVYTLGHSNDWRAVNQADGAYVKLPAYPWTLNSYGRLSDEDSSNLFSNDRHVLFDQRLNCVNPTWEFEINTQILPWLPDHVVDDSVVMPGAAYVEFALALALRDQLQRNADEQPHPLTTAVTLQDVTFHQVLVDRDSVQTRLQASIDEKTGNFSLHTRVTGQNKTTTCHATGKVIENAAPAANFYSDFQCDPSVGKSIDITEFYQSLHERGLTYGQHFQTVKSIERLSQHTIVAKLELSGSKESDSKGYLLHPTLLDGAFQCTLAALDDSELKRPFVPVHIDNLQLLASIPSTLNCLVELRASNSTSIEADITLFDESQNVLALLRGVRCQALAGATENKDSLQGVFHQLEWTACQGPENLEKPAHGHWLLYGPAALTDSCVDSGLFENCNITCVSNNSAVKFSTDKYPYELTDILLLDTFDGSNSNDNDLTGISQRIAFIKTLLENNTSNEIVVRQVTRNAQVVVEGDNGFNLQGAALNALGILIENEHPNLIFQSIDLASKEDLFDHLGSIVSRAPFREMAFRNGQFYRHQLTNTHLQPIARETVPMNLQEHSVALRQHQPGDVNSLSLTEISIPEPKPNEVQIRIKTSSLNFKDVLKVYGQLADSVMEDTYCGNTLGSEASGLVVQVGSQVTSFKPGDEVIAIMPDSFRSLANVRADYVMQKPVVLTMFEAPALITYLTAWYGLIDKAELAKGESVLIHNATGGVGYVALQIARYKQARIFASAGTEKKRQYLRDLGVERVYDSRSLAFAEQIYHDTDRRGVDVVFNAMAGEALNQSFELLAPFGRFIEIGKKNIADNHPLAMRAFQDNLSFSAIDIDRMLFGRNDLAIKLIRDVDNAFKQGCFGPIPIEVYKADKAIEAFQYMARAEHIGKVVLDFTDTLAPVVSADHRNRRIRSDGSYLVTGGTRGFGLEIARWLAAQGAGELVLISRSGMTAETEAVLTEMESSGTRVRVHSADVTCEKTLEQLINSFDDALPLRGIFHAAVVLEDGFIKTLDQASLERVLHAKMMSALYLHKLTQSKPLDIFFCFSSISALVGNTGQASYVIANAYLDALCQYRRSQGLAANSVNWGAISDVGIVSRNKDVAQLFEKQGLYSISPAEACEILDRILINDPVQIAAIRIDWEKSANSTTMLGKSDSRFSGVVGEQSGGADNPVGAKLIDLRESCPETTEFSEYVKTITLEQIAALLKIPVDQIDESLNITQMGIDSLSAVELGVSLKLHLGVDFSPVKLLAGPTPDEIADLALSEYREVESMLESKHDLPAPAKQATSSSLAVAI